jgi:hypothetical protein
MCRDGGKPTVELVYCRILGTRLFRSLGNIENVLKEYFMREFITAKKWQQRESQR